NSLAAVQALPAGSTVTDTLTVKSKDGTANQDIVVTITGANDTALISGTATGAVTEDATVPTASGKLIVTDVDTGEAEVIAQSNVKGVYGTFNIEKDGNWTYTLDNSLAAVQALPAGSTVTDTLTVKSKDGTANQDIVVTITGTNDAPIASNNTITTDTDVVTNLGLTAPTDIDGDSLTITVEHLPTIGTITLADGTTVVKEGDVLTSAELTGLKYQAPAGYNAGDAIGQFNYTVSDGHVTVDGAVTININDKTPPAAPTVTIVQDKSPDDDYLNKAELEGVSEIQIKVTLPTDNSSYAGVKVGDEINLTITTVNNSDSSTSKLLSHIVTQSDLDNGYIVTVPNTTDLKSITATATVTDQANNTSGDASDSAILDIVPPTITITNVAGNDDIVQWSEKSTGSTGFTLSGTLSGVEADQKITLTFKDATNTFVSKNEITVTANMVSSGKWSVDLSQAEAALLKDGTAYAAVSDKAGNTATADKPYSVDAPSDGLVRITGYVDNIDYVQSKTQVNANTDSLSGSIKGRYGETLTFSVDNTDTTNVIEGQYGQFTFTTTGEWTYVLNEDVKTKIENKAYPDASNPIKYPLNDKLTVTDASGGTYEVQVAIKTNNTTFAGDETGEISVTGTTVKLLTTTTQVIDSDLMTGQIDLNGINSLTIDGIKVEYGKAYRPANGAGEFTLYDDGKYTFEPYITGVPVPLLLNGVAISPAIQATYVVDNGADQGVGDVHYSNDVLGEIHGTVNTSATYQVNDETKATLRFYVNKADTTSDIDTLGYPTYKDIEVSVDSTGKWSITQEQLNEILQTTWWAGELREDNIYLQVKVVDPVTGKTSNATQEYSFVTDTSAPVATGVEYNGDAHQVSAFIGNRIAVGVDKQIAALAGDKVEVYYTKVDGSKIKVGEGVVQADTENLYDGYLPIAVAIDTDKQSLIASDATKTDFTVYVTDSAGNTGASDTNDFNLADRPVAPIITGYLDNVNGGVDFGNSNVLNTNVGENPEQLTNDNKGTITGLIEADDKVDAIWLYFYGIATPVKIDLFNIDGSPKFTTIVEEGKTYYQWQMLPGQYADAITSGTLTDNTIPIKAYGYDKESNMLSKDAGQIIIKVDTVAPIVTVTSIANDNVVNIAENGSNGFTITGKVSGLDRDINGVIKSYSYNDNTVNVTQKLLITIKDTTGGVVKSLSLDITSNIDNVPEGSIYIDTNGNWTLAASKLASLGLTDGQSYTVTAAATDLAGNTSTGTNQGSKSFSVDLTPPSVTVTINPNKDAVTIVFTEVPTKADGTVMSADEVKAILQLENVDLVGNISSNDGGKTWTSAISAQSEGTMKVTVPNGSYYDAAGNPGTVGDTSTTNIGQTTVVAPVIETPVNPIVSPTMTTTSVGSKTGTVSGNTFNNASTGANDGVKTAYFAYDLKFNVAGAPVQTIRAEVNLSAVDNSFSILINGKDIRTGETASATTATIFQLQKGDNTLGTSVSDGNVVALRFADGSWLDNPWTSIAKDVPRYKIVITDDGIRFYGTKTSSSTEMKELFVSEFNSSSLVKIPLTNNLESLFTNAENTVTIVNNNGTGADALAGNFAVTVGNRFDISDNDSALLSKAVITLTGWNSSDVMTPVLAGPITSSHTQDGTTYILTLSGIATVKDYEDTINSIMYSSQTNGNRTINIQITDTSGLSTTVNGSINYTTSNGKVTLGEFHYPDNTVVAKAGNETISTGSDGNDTLIYNVLTAADAKAGHTGIDTWTDFHLGNPSNDTNADTIKFASDFFSGLTQAILDTDNASTVGKFISVNSVDGKTTISIDRNGDVDGTLSYQELLVLNNTNTTLQELLENNQIIIG
ncbi:VCBS domain-containing protein, partial [Acinetobacter baumannii]|uniref:VCBS domain-containing protein n=1 Tax=Acinetobacter baumannii TaxID=470 RepID=UPI003891C782